jgi:hypothetical protein
MCVDRVWLEMIRESSKDEFVENAAIVYGAVKLDFIVTVFVLAG